ncbi:MAG: hypothetical protein DRH03_01140 [Deltaproteobacteria bacterium]|nr:MAG: hypothetical protein DRH03_01140 [Deltaproteobacteria bacterium]
MPEISPLDYAFLALESKESPKHVAPVKILRPPEGAPADYVSRFVVNLRQRQPQPPFNYKIKLTIPNLLGAILPGLPATDLAMPQWSVLSSVDMEQHVFHHVLPKPGSKDQLTQKVQELHQTLLDRSRPLWECHVIEGYEDGQRFALYIKIHHALADGALLAARLITNTGTEPDSESGKVFWELPGGVTSQSESSENLLDDVSHMAKYMINSGNMLGNMYMSVLRSGVGALLQAGSKEKKEAQPFTAPLTQLDQQPGIGRSLAFAKVSLARVKSLSKATGATINDLLLTFLDMGVRRYLADSGEEPEKRMSALMPMSLRDGKLDPSQSNCVSIATVLLGDAQATPLERLRDIAKETLKVKGERKLSSDMAMANSLVLAGLAQIGESLNLVGTMQPLGNFIFSNVPGPREIRYQLDARIEEVYPVSCLSPGSYMNSTVYSYGGDINFNFIALADAAPNLNDLAEHVIFAVAVMEREVFGESAMTAESQTLETPVAAKKAASSIAKPGKSVKSVVANKAVLPVVKKPKAKVAKPKASKTVAKKRAAKVPATKKPAVTPVKSTKVASSKKPVKVSGQVSTAKKTVSTKSAKAAPKKTVKSPAKVSASDKSVLSPDKPTALQKSGQSAAKKIANKVKLSEKSKKLKS